jgi:hypothetical protein
MAKSHRTARRRAFVPCADGIPPLERRAVPGPLLFDLWTIPQSYISLTSSSGQTYEVTGGRSLIRGLQQIAANGQTVGSLFIKGHGDNDIILLSDTDLADSLAVVQGNILIAGEPVNNLLASVTGPRTAIYLTGCGTATLAQSLSGLLPGVVAVGNTLPKAIGVPWTSMSLGRYIQYRNGEPL